jgi:hypothetical protein
MVKNLSFGLAKNLPGLQGTEVYPCSKLYNTKAGRVSVTYRCCFFTSQVTVSIRSPAHPATGSRGIEWNGQ